MILGYQLCDIVTLTSMIKKKVFSELAEREKGNSGTVSAFMIFMNLMNDHMEVLRRHGINPTLNKEMANRYCESIIENWEARKTSRQSENMKKKLAVCTKFHSTARAWYGAKNVIGGNSLYHLLFIYYITYLNYHTSNEDYNLAGGAASIDKSAKSGKTPRKCLNMSNCGNAMTIGAFALPKSSKSDGILSWTEFCMFLLNPLMSLGNNDEKANEDKKNIENMIKDGSLKEIDVCMELSNNNKQDDEPVTKKQTEPTATIGGVVRGGDNGSFTVLSDSSKSLEDCQKEATEKMAELFRNRGTPRKKRGNTKKQDKAEPTDKEEDSDTKKQDKTKSTGSNNVNENSKQQENEKEEMKRLQVKTRQMTKEDELKKNKNDTDPTNPSTENVTTIVEPKAVSSKRKLPMKNMSPNKKKKAFNFVSPDLHQKKQEHVLENAGILVGLWDLKDTNDISVECKQLNDLCNLHEEYESISLGDVVLHKDKYLVYKILNKVDVVIINALLKETIFDTPTSRGLNPTKKEEIMKTFQLSHKFISSRVHLFNQLVFQQEDIKLMMTEVNGSNGYILMESIGDDDMNKNENNLDESAMDIEKGDDDKYVATLNDAFMDYADLTNNEVKDTNEDSSDGEPEDYGKDEDEDYKEDEE